VAKELGVDLGGVADPARDSGAASLGFACGSRGLSAVASRNGARIVEIDRFELDVIPSGTLVVTRHNDVPGMIGRVGTILGDAGINISTMHVARDARGALMVLAVDRPLSSDALAPLRSIFDMQSVTAVDV